MWILREKSKVKRQGIDPIDIEDDKQPLSPFERTKLLVVLYSVVGS